MADIQELVTKIGFQVNQTSVRNATNNLRNFGGMAAQIATRVVQEVDKITKDVVETANRAGAVDIPFNEYRQLINTFQQQGISASKAQSAITKLNKKIGDAKDNVGKDRQEFADMGIQIDETTSETTFEVLEKIAKNFSKIDNAALIAADSQKLFGQNNQELGQILKSTDGDLRKIVELSNSFKPVFTDEDVQNAREMQILLTQMWQIFRDKSAFAVIRGVRKLFKTIDGLQGFRQRLGSKIFDIVDAANINKVIKAGKDRFDVLSAGRRAARFNPNLQNPPVQLPAPRAAGAGGLDVNNTFNVNVDVSGGSRGDIQDIQNATFQGTNDASNLLEQMLQNIVTGNPREE